jgi:hypothetical protein
MIRCVIETAGQQMPQNAVRLGSAIVLNYGSVFAIRWR